MVTPPATRDGGYRLLNRIGEGGMGVVHLATTDDGELVAVKLLRPTFVGGSDGRARMARELATLRRVTGAHVAEVLDADIDAEPPYIVTAYVPGPSLHDVIASHGPLTTPALRSLASGLVAAMRSVHAAGVVHRDIKPGNVMMATHGPVLIDFGVARAAEDARLTMTGVVPGTPGFLAPETLLSQPPTAATDIHGWAATLVYAASGLPPYGRGHDAVVLDRIRRDDRDTDAMRGLRERADADLAALVDAALSPDPGRRPDVAELAALLDVRDGVDPAPVVGGGDPTGAARGDVPPLSTSRPASTAVEPTPRTSVEPAPAGAADDNPDAPRPVRAVVPPPAPRPTVRTYGAPASRVAGVTMGLLAATTAAYALNPALVVLALLAAAVVGRVVGRAAQTLIYRRRVRGSRLRDTVGLVLRSPIYLIGGAVGATGQAILAASAGLATAGALAAVTVSPRLSPLAAGLVTTVLMWWGPFSGAARWGTRWMARPLLANGWASWVTAASLVVLTWLLLMAWESYGTSWEPLPPELAQWLQ
jgi:hypothetical protein